MRKRGNALGTILFVYLMALFIFSLSVNAAEPESTSGATPAVEPSAATSETPSPAPAAPTAQEPKNTPTLKRYKKVFAVIEFEQGGKSLGKPVKIELFEKKAPKTVESFINLAEGKVAFDDPKTKKKVTRPFYDGLTIHRVVPNFVIQGGDPNGNGTGRPHPEYKIPDEISPDLKHDKAGVVAMANAGPNTAGSQFYITLGPQHFLDNGPTRYTIFGQVVEGMETVQTIGSTKTKPGNFPVVPVIMKKVTIVRE